jgi:hypothetical protein
LELTLSRLFSTGEMTVVRRRDVEAVMETARVVSRRLQRIESGTIGFSGSRPPPLVVHRPAATVDAAAVSQDVSLTRDTSGYDRGRPGQYGFNVADLTEQVIREIDQRATAWRERTGRV